MAAGRSRHPDDLVVTWRIARGAASIAVSVVVWTLLASAAFVWLGNVPWNCWFYYAVPWPETFWDRAYLVISGLMASAPFGLVVQFWWHNLGSKPAVYGTTGWATPRQMQTGGLHLRDKL